MATAPPALTPVLEFPATGDPAFNAKAYAWATAERTTVAPEIAALAANAYANAQDANTQATNAGNSATTASTQAGTASTQAGIAATQAGNAATSATAAAASAATATNASNVNGTSTSSNSIPTALGQSRTFVFVESSRSVVVGMNLIVAVTASAATNFMALQVTSWTPGTGTLVGNVISFAGTGTYSAWSISLSGAQGAAGTLSGTAVGPVNLLTGASIPSAATVNLNTRTGDRVHITGAAAITAFTLTNGPVTLVFDGALTLTHHATNNNLPGAANIITAAGDRAIYESDGAAVYCIDYTRADGLPTLGITQGSARNYAIASYTSSGTFVVPAGVTRIRGYNFGRGGNAWSDATGNLTTNFSGGGAGCAYGDIPVAPGQAVTVTISAGVATMVVGGVTMLTANAASGATGGTASIHASVTNGGAYSGGNGFIVTTGFTTNAPGGASSGSPLGTGVSSGSNLNGGRGWGTSHGSEQFGPSGNFTGPGGAGGAGTSPSNLPVPGPARSLLARYTDPLLATFTSGGSATGLPSGDGAGAAGAGNLYLTGSTYWGGFTGLTGGFGGGGSPGYNVVNGSFTVPQKGGTGGFGAGGGSSSAFSSSNQGTTVGGDGGYGGGGGAAVSTQGFGPAVVGGTGGAACVLIYY